MLIKNSKGEGGGGGGGEGRREKKRENVWVHVCTCISILPDVCSFPKIIKISVYEEKISQILKNST